MENPNYYAVIPAEIRYDKSLKANAKLLYGEITALSNKSGECWASNNFFAELYDVDPSAISRWVKNLEKSGYITIEYIRGKNSEIEKRIIRIKVLPDSNRVLTKNGEGYCKKRKENNTSINNKEEEKEINKEKVEIQNQDYKNVINFYEDNITLITPTVAEDIENYLFNDRLQADLIIACMKEAVNRNKRNWHYVVSILNDCCNNNIKTAKQFKIKQEEFKSNKNQKTKNDKTKEKVEYEEVDFTNEEEYVEKILGKG